MKNHPDFDKNLIHNSTFELDDGRVTKYEILKNSRWQTHAIYTSHIENLILAITQQSIAEF